MERFSWPGLLGRRDLLRVGSLGVSAARLPGAREGSASSSEGKVESVVLLWMAGGGTHIDSFDPKPDAPEQIRGPQSTIATTLPGVRVAECMPGLARQAHRLALVRSYSHDSNDHFLSQAYALSGRKVGMDRI